MLVLSIPTMLKIGRFQDKDKLKRFVVPMLVQHDKVIA